MNDHYQTLGVSEGASPEEIKKAYRSLANKHHPDKGGDQAKFKDISVAYETLSDAQKKAEYDQQRMYGGGQQFHFNTGNMHDIFGGMHNPFGANHPFGDIFGRQVRRNRDLNITCQISLLDSYTGKQLEANYQLPSGRNQNVVINIPPGISHGETIRYQGLGDDSIAGIQRGNLNVTVVVLPDHDFIRQGDDIYTNINISPIEAMIGCRKKVKTITGEEKEVEIRAGVETGTEFAQGGGGFINNHTRNRGRFVSVVQIRTPAVTDPVIIERLQQLQNELSSRS